MVGLAAFWTLGLLLGAAAGYAACRRGWLAPVAAVPARQDGGGANRSPTANQEPRHGVWLEALLSRVDGRMVQHSSQIHEISEELVSLSANDPDLVMAAVVQILAENHRVQADLAAAQAEIDTQRRQAETLAAEARTDILTKLPNRRSFDQELSRRFDQWKRQQVPLSLVLIDVDHFKCINDTHGHPAGDAILRQVAAVLADTVRLMDIPARYGGEEFAVILAGTAMPGATRAAERLRATIAGHSFVLDGATLPMTVSVGVATLSAGETCEGLIRRTDQALYAAKRAGRNCAWRHDEGRAEPIETDLSLVRSPYRRVQSIAPYRGSGELPDETSYREVLCYDLSPQGISFLVDEPPDFDHLVLKLGQPPDERFLVCRVANVTAVSDGEAPAFRVGCCFVDRLDTVGRRALALA